MNNQNFTPEAIEASAKASFENATQTFDLIVNKTSQLLEKNVAAAKTTIERHATYLNSFKDVRDIEDFVKVQENIGRTETEALENFSREIYELSSSAAAELTKVSETSHTAAKEFVNESLENVAKTIPNGSTQPYGSFFQDAVRAQIDVFNNFNNFVEKTVAVQKANFDALTDAVTEAGTTAKVSKSRKTTGKSK